MSYATPIAHTSGGTFGPGTTSAIDTTGADLIVIVAGGQGSTNTVSDSKGNTWTALTQQSSTGILSRIFYCQNPTVGTGHTFTNTIDNFSVGAIAVAAFSGSTSSPFDQQNGAGAGFTGSIACGSVTPTQANELIVCGGLFYVGESTLTIDAGQTRIEYLQSSSGNYTGVGLAYEIQTTATTRNPTWTINNGGEAQLNAHIATFKSGGAGPAPKTRTLPMMGASLSSSIALAAAGVVYTALRANPVTSRRTFWKGE